MVDPRLSKEQAVAGALAYWAAGMSVFDAVGHAFSTLATGGFSTHDANFGYFDSGLLYRVLTWLALLQGVDSADGAALAKLVESLNIDVDSRGCTRVHNDPVELTSVSLSNARVGDQHG